MTDFPLTVERIQHPLDASYFISNNFIYYRPLTARAERAFSRLLPDRDYPGCYGFAGTTQPNLISDNNLLVAPEDTMI